MKKPVLIRPRADQDMDEIFVYLRSENPRAARRFLGAVQAALDLLGKQPQVGSSRHAQYCPELPAPLRFVLVSGFPRILVYYLELPKRVEVLRIWDAARGLEALMAEIE